MKATNRRQQGKPAFDVIEEATHLLRTAPPATLAVYFLGAVPFVLGLLFFWADMSRSPLAPQHLAQASLGMTVLFLWMKFWQAVFARRIRALAAGEPCPPLTPRRCARIIIHQSILQPLGLFILPLASIPLLPLGWAFAFYQSVSALDDGDEKGIGPLIKDSRQQSLLWPKQNHLLLLYMSAFGLAVFLNWLSVCFMVPGLIKLLFGIESVFTRSPMAMLNTTLFATICSLTYLCVDPIIKTIYALRCFYGESLQSGEDLKAELKPFANPVIGTAAAALLLLAIFTVSPALAQSTNAPSGAPIGHVISPPNLDHAINQTIHERKYVWRMPREQAVEPEDSKDSVFINFLVKVGAMLRHWARTVLDWLQEILKKLFHHQLPASGNNSPGYGWIMAVEIFLYVLVAGVIIALVIFLIRVWRGRRMTPVPVAGEAIQPVPDLTDENVRADQLPEDGWTKLARELLERGEFRLAMRAFYLAGLAHLAARNLISIARFKSNRDYEGELRRRAHAFPNLLSVFGDNISAFERIWYGMHEATRDMVLQFAANLERLKGNG